MLYNFFSFPLVLKKNYPKAVIPEGSIPEGSLDGKEKKKKKLWVFIVF